MNHLGILAHSVEGAALCLRAFCQEGFRELGPHDHPDVTLDCIALARSMPAWEAGDYAAIRAVLAGSADGWRGRAPTSSSARTTPPTSRSKRAGDDLALPGLNIAEVVAERAARDGRRRVGILGTRYTMDGPVYPRALGARGIVAELPAEAERRIVDRIIFDELVNGIFSDDSRHEYGRIIERLRDRGCDAVALVCTEIPLLVTPEVSPLPTLDSTRLLARAAFEVAVGRRPLPTWRGGRSRTEARER